MFETGAGQGSSGTGAGQGSSGTGAGKHCVVRNVSWK